ncbi:hypothetical protein Bca52824_024957 [Brassica carinata]|uniref:Uncharacterized protein n=1 Tax=Brassica carinata TaxID=52824 RepID=A0A8X7VL68_BRACI|nr:hypothetical protein Bca52824_024957 [Brassica carinata]
MSLSELLAKEKTGGEIIYRVGGVMYLFRGGNYNYRTRPQYPLMLWEPAAPVYPKLIQEIPEGYTKDEALEFMELVPCLLLYFDDEQILMWRER